MSLLLHKIRTWWIGLLFFKFRIYIWLQIFWTKCILPPSLKKKIKYKFKQKLSPWMEYIARVNIFHDEISMRYSNKSPGEYNCFNWNQKEMYFFFVTSFDRDFFVNKSSQYVPAYHTTCLKTSWGGNIPTQRNTRQGRTLRG